MYRGIQRLRSSGSSVLRYLKMPHLRRKAYNSWSAIEDTYFSAKDIFERHKVVFTVSTSIASVATAWIGYTLRHYHQSRVDQRLESIESAMKNKYQLEDHELRKLVSGTMSVPACAATAGTTLFVGYCLGWRGGKWYANRKYRREQMKLLGQINPRRWPLKFLRRPLVRPLRLRSSETAAKTSELSQQNASDVESRGRTHPAS